MVIASNLGFPRIGSERELKKAVEAFWAGKATEAQLAAAGSALRQAHWRLQQRAGIKHIPSNDFSFYDHVLDTCVLVGAIPERYGWTGGPCDWTTYFAMARGAATVPAMEMTKWFDTNYHYIVPEFEPGMRFALASRKPIAEFQEAKGRDIPTRPVLLGPVSFALLGKSKDPRRTPLDFVDALLPVYVALLEEFAGAGAEWVQIDEPCLSLDLSDAARAACERSYARLAVAAPRLKLLLATYFEGLHDNLPLACALPVAALHLDCVRAPGEWETALTNLPPAMALSLGVVDGRNIWKTDLAKAATIVERAVQTLGTDRVLVGPSCSMLHVPIDLTLENQPHSGGEGGQKWGQSPEIGTVPISGTLPAPGIDSELKNWLAFAAQKLDEIVCLARCATEGRSVVATELAANAAAIAARNASPRIHNPAVATRMESITAEMTHRPAPYATRREEQQKRLGLPPFPTTTIGSFPQTPEVRAARANFRAGKLDRAGYERFLEEEIADTIRTQESIGLDVLVHGEFERNDMVEYFGEQLEGFAFTGNGWVQSYGSRCVKPPVIFGDVARPTPMTVRWSQYAQSLTTKPVKGMLTGPVTILQWSFVRDDQPRSATCRQIALAIRDEVADLEAAGIRAIQIDEPALREGLPLRRRDWGAYLEWAVEAFRLAAAGAKPATQIHTHMCYSEFNDIIEAIAAMDADVISIESSRSQMELLKAFDRYQYPNEIGPGVYDIHSPRVPTEDEVEGLLRKALKVLKPTQLWVNPDCGLKTRRWEETKPSLAALVATARKLRKEFARESS